MGMGAKRKARENAGDTGAEGAAATAYERLREANIQKNKAILAGLDITPLPEPEPAALRAKKPKREAAPASRRSGRIVGMPASAPVVDSYIKSVAEEKREERAAENRQLEQGWKVKVGGKAQWRGERYGAVPGVEVGAVFGDGDWQRAGRTEMSESGFFVPFVQPEWLEVGGGAYSIIVNNDNGSSEDNGDEILYVGGGGRMRGQNRSADQSFHQDWSNLTNASLKRTHESGKPVRVIRGPKVTSQFRPKNGGYRYDGLYTVTNAYQRLNEKKLRQCVFQLTRCPGQPPLPTVK